MKMNLEEVNAKLLEIGAALEEKIKLLANAELAYDIRFAKLSIESPRSSQGARDLEAKQICIQENLFQPFMEAKIEVRTLYMKKEILEEYGANLRTLMVHGDINRGMA